MIKINLATRKQFLQTPVEGSVDIGSTLGKINLDPIKGLPLKKVLIPLVIAYAASFLLDNYKQDQLNQLGEALVKENAEASKIQATLSKYKEYDAMKKVMDEDEITIKTKLDTIKTLIADRSVTLKTLIEVSKGIPESVWLNELKLSREEIQLGGGSTDFNLISDFMRNLKGLSYFSSVELVDTHQQTGKTEVETAQFMLKLKRK